MRIILIGSSPAMMLQALVLSTKYNQIEIYERSSQIGGSWRTSNFNNLKRVETGTHILAPWKNNSLFKQSLKILEKKLGLNLYLVLPRPTRVNNKNIAKKDFNKFKYYYVEGGANKILNHLYSLIKKKKNKNFF